MKFNIMHQLSPTEFEAFTFNKAGDLIDYVRDGLRAIQPYSIQWVMEAGGHPFTGKIPDQVVTRLKKLQADYTPRSSILVA